MKRQLNHRHAASLAAPAVKVSARYCAQTESEAADILLQVLRGVVFAFGHGRFEKWRPAACSSFLITCTTLSPLLPSPPSPVECPS